MKYVSTTLSPAVLDSLRAMGYIHDYTDDGFVLHSTAGWIPLSDVLEMLFAKAEEDSREERQTPIEDSEIPF